MTQNHNVAVSMNQAAAVKTGLVFKQGDFGFNLVITVLDFDVTGTTPQIVFRKPMGAVESTSITASGNTYTYVMKGTELDTPGKVFCDLKLKNSTTQRISSASFMFEVVADTLDGLAEESSSYSDTIEQIVAGFDGKFDIRDQHIDSVLKQINRTPITMTPDKSINLSTLVIDRTALVNNPGFACAVVPCQKGDIFIVTAKGLGIYRAYAFIDADGNRKQGSASGSDLDNQKLTAPSDGYLLINDSSSAFSYAYDYFYTEVATKTEVDEKLTPTHGINLFDPNDDGITEGKYIYTDGSLKSNASYLVSGFIKVTPGTTYYFDGCVPSGSTTCSAFYKADKTTLVSVGGMTSETAPADAGYLKVTVVATNRFNSAQVADSETTYNPFVGTNYVLPDTLAKSFDKKGTYSKGDVVTKDGLIYKAKHAITTAGDFNGADWDLLRSFTEAINNAGVEFGENSISNKGYSLAANTKVELTGQTNVAKNVIYQFCATFSTFEKLEIGQGEHSTKYASWIEIDDTKIDVYRSAGGTSYAHSEYTHGLTISDFINVQIVTNDEYKCKVIIQTKEDENEVDVYASDGLASFMGNCVGKYYFISDTAISDYSFTIILKDATKPVYLFGDSYMSFVPERWVYYLKDIGCFNSVLINACSGMNSSGASNALAGLQGKPKYALWGLGMNDSADTDSSTPASNWMNGYNSFIAWCTRKGCEPILATIPTIPSKLHEGKNNFIRSSGHRYVDFAKALSPNGDGTWYPGMINPDDYVHPTQKGAIAMYNRALADFPEVAGQLT